MEWMIINPPTLEEELQIEATLREVRACEDLTALRELCVALTQQGWHQAKLLKQAVHHIASLDESMATLDR